MASLDARGVFPFRENDIGPGVLDKVDCGIVSISLELGNNLSSYSFVFDCRSEFFLWTCSRSWSASLDDVLDGGMLNRATGLICSVLYEVFFLD